MNANVVAAEEPLGRCPEVFDSWGSNWEVKRGGGGQEIRSFLRGRKAGASLCHGHGAASEDAAVPG